MDVTVFALYDGTVATVAAIGIGYLLFSRRFLVIHDRFFLSVMVGLVLLVFVMLSSVLLGVAMAHVAHGLLLLALTIGFLDLAGGMAAKNESWFQLLFDQ